MNIGIISDTHNIIPSAKKALDTFSQYNIQLLIHCGDWTSPEMINFISTETQMRKIPLKGVFGNRDENITEMFNYAHSGHVSIELPKDDYLEFDIDNKKYAVTHGHKNNILNELISSGKYTSLFTGHTHKVKVETINNTTIINPGSTAFSIPRSHNFKPSIIIYDSNSNKAEVIYVDTN